MQDHPLRILPVSCARILPPSQKRSGSTALMMYNQRGSSTTHIISAQNVSDVNVPMYVEKSSSAISIVLPVSNAIRYATHLPKNNAAGWTRLLMSATAVPNLRADAPSFINISMTQSSPSLNMRRSGHHQGKASVFPDMMP